MDTERLGDDRRKDAEEKAVGEPTEGGNEEELVRVGDGESADLRKREDERCDGETPCSAGMKTFYKEIGADTAQKATHERAHR